MTLRPRGPRKPPGGAGEPRRHRNRKRKRSTASSRPGSLGNIVLLGSLGAGAGARGDCHPCGALSTFRFGFSPPSPCQANLLDPGFPVRPATECARAPACAEVC